MLKKFILIFRCAIDVKNMDVSDVTNHQNINKVEDDHERKEKEISLKNVENKY